MKASKVGLPIDFSSCDLKCNKWYGSDIALQKMKT